MVILKKEKKKKKKKKMAKGLVFFWPIGSGFRQWRIGEWLARA